MEKTYGSKKKAEEVLYASKNSGKITGIDSIDFPETDAQKRVRQVAYQFNSSLTGVVDMMDPDEEEGIEGMGEGATGLDNLPSFVDFKRNIKDALHAGIPMEKVLDFGTTWGVSRGKSFGKAAFQKSMKDALKNGLSIDKAIRLSLDSVKAGEGIISGETWAGTKKDKLYYRVVDFKASMRDALKAGRSVSDAIKHSLDCGKDCECCK